MREKLGQSEEQQPEEEREPERTSGIIRVPGVSPEREKEILGTVEKEIFDKQEFFKQEREKTPEEKEIVNGILAHLPEFVRGYGGKPVPLRSEHIHTIDIDKLSDEQKKNMEDMRGRYFFGSQRAAVLVDSKNDSKLDFAERSAHELIHFNSFQSADFEPGKLSERVFGFAIMTKDGEELVPYFNDVNEAITGELAKRFDQEYFKAISALTEEIQQRDKFRAGLKSKSGATEIKSFSLKQEESGMWRARAGEYPYIEERQRLWATIADIRSKNTGQFKSNEDVFRIFTEAYFTGKFKKVAKLIDKTYGKGSFRELGKKTKAQKAAEQEKK